MCKRFTVSLLLLLILFRGYAQNIDSLLRLQRATDPQEKVYVHFDKNHYSPGETIWFKAYVFSGIDPSETSKNFYAELIDEQGNVYGQKTAPIAFSGASGSFDLDSNLNKRLLYFRGYTISMLNSDTAFLYTKAIRILSSKTGVAKPAAIARTTTAKFLPEGGDMIYGLPSKVAFIATDQ